MNKEQLWCCDFCGKAGLTISRLGMIYCRFCKKSYDQNLYDLAKKLIGEKE